MASAHVISFQLAFHRPRLLLRFIRNLQHLSHLALKSQRHRFNLLQYPVPSKRFLIALFMWMHLERLTLLR